MLLSRWLARLNGGRLPTGGLTRLGSRALYSARHAAERRRPGCALATYGTSRCTTDKFSSPTRSYRTSRTTRSQRNELGQLPGQSVDPVSDMTRAREFYEGKLGLTPGADQPDGSQLFACGGGTSLHVYPSPSAAGQATQATWEVPDLAQVVDNLSASVSRAFRKGS